MPDWFAKYQEARIFFRVEKEIVLFKKKKIFVSPNSDKYSNVYIILQYWLVHHSFSSTSFLQLVRSTCYRNSKYIEIVKPVFKPIKCSFTPSVFRRSRPRLSGGQLASYRDLVAKNFKSNIHNVSQQHHWKCCFLPFMDGSSVHPWMVSFNWALQKAEALFNLAIHQFNAEWNFRGEIYRLYL